MSPSEQKPIVHGRDHMTDGADPIPGLDELGGGGGGAGFAMPGHRLGSTEDRWYMAGMITTNSLGTNSSAIGRFAWPFIPTRDMTLDRIGIQVTAAISSSTARLAIYTDDGNIYPNALLVDTGSFATSAPTGPKLQTISQALDAGELYWLAIHFSHGSVQCRSAQTSTCIPILGFGQPSGTTSPAVSFGWENLGVAITAFPDPFPGGATPQDLTTGVLPCVMVRGT